MVLVLGGVAIFVKKCLNPRSISVVNDDHKFNTVWVEISVPNFGMMNLAGYYRPDWVTVSDLCDNMQSFMTKFGHKNCFIGGDMNLNILSMNRETSHVDLINSFGFSISNDKVTRLASGTLLDHAISNFQEKFQIVNSTINNDFSDHSIVLSEIHVSLLNESQTYYKNFTDFELFKLNLIQNLQDEERHSSNVNSYCNFILDSLKTALISSSRSVLVHKRKSFMSLD